MNYDKIFESEKIDIYERDLMLVKDYLHKKQGWVYIARSNNNDLLKIGRTGKNPWERARTLSTTGVLHDYEILFSLHFLNQFIAEKEVHRRLKKYRISKEFFSLKLDTAIESVQAQYEEETKFVKRYFDPYVLREDIELLDIAWVKQ